MSIPVSKLVNVLPGVLAAAGTANSLNGLILTANGAVPVGTVQSFPDPASVGAFFGLSSPEYAAALIYFKGPDNARKTPSALLFAQYPSAAVGAYLRSATQTITLAQLKAIAAGTLTINLNGTPLTSSSISLSGATSFSNAAALILAGFTSPGFGVTFDAQRNAFLFTSTATGSTQAITYATGTLAAPLGLTQATGAVLSQGAAIATPAAFMAGLIAVSQSWSGFTTMFEPVTADKISFSDWTDSTNDSFFYAGYDSDVNVVNQQGATSTWGYAVAANDDSGSHLIVGGISHAAFVLGWAGATDFTLRNGRSTLAYRQQTGLLPSLTDAVSYQNALANGYNGYGQFASKTDEFLRYQNGTVSGPYLWMDSFINQIWLRGNLQSAMLTLLSQVGTIPYNATGYALIDAAAADPINAAINFGAIVSGVTLSTEQVQELTNAIGVDVSPSLFALGWYLQVNDAAAGTRVTRGSPPIALYYTDGQSIQTINLSAIEVQ